MKPLLALLLSAFGAMAQSTITLENRNGEHTNDMQLMKLWAGAGVDPDMNREMPMPALPGYLAQSAIVPGLSVMLLQQSQPPVTLAQHGPPYSETNFIPYEVRFMLTAFQLKGGHRYTLQFSENLTTWDTVAPPYDPPVDDVWTPGAAYYVNGAFVPLGFFRMVEE